MKTGVMKESFDEERTHHVLVRLALLALVLLVLLAGNAMTGGTSRSGQALDITDSLRCRVVHRDGTTTTEDLTSAILSEGDFASIEVPVPAGIKDPQVVLAFTTA